MRGQRLASVNPQPPFLHLQCSLRIKRSDWWRLKRFVSASLRQSRFFGGVEDICGVRFLTIATCFLAATIYDSVSTAAAIRARERTLTAVWLVVDGLTIQWGRCDARILRCCSLSWR